MRARPKGCFFRQEKNGKDLATFRWAWWLGRATRPDPCLPSPVCEHGVVLKWLLAVSTCVALCRGAVIPHGPRARVVYSGPPVCVRALVVTRVRLNLPRPPMPFPQPLFPPSPPSPCYLPVRLRCGTCLVTGRSAPLSGVARRVVCSSAVWAWGFCLGKENIEDTATPPPLGVPVPLLPQALLGVGGRLSPPGVFLGCAIANCWCWC